MGCLLTGCLWVLFLGSCGFSCLVNVLVIRLTIHLLCGVACGCLHVVFGLVCGDLVVVWLMLAGY